MSERDYDVILYGAGGFTGQQTVAYFAQHAKAVRWAIAGRNQAKLAALKAQCGTAAPDILIADAHDQAALDAIISRTRVLLTTAGPFALYGTKIVDACVRFKTHYVDITGETVWVKDLIDRYHVQAAADGTRIVPFCGFDSIPSDLGAFVLAQHMQKNLGARCKQVKAYFQMAGGLNGGTVATAFHMAESGQTQRARDPFILNPTQQHAPEEIRANQDPIAPQYEPALGAWIGPFIMGSINTRVVRRSNALFGEWGEPYGPNFSYQEYTKFSGAAGRLAAYGMTAGLGLFQLALASPLRPLVKALLPPPGAGPSEQTMNEGWFKCELWGETTDGRTIRGVIKDKGDPGNRATVKFLCESALCLAENFEALPGGKSRGGILTPATAFGAVLAQRLRQTGMTIEIE